MAGSLTERMQGAAMLNVATYEEVEADENATGQAATVIAIVAVATAIGNAFGGEGSLIGGIIGGIIGAFIGWVIWAAVTYFVGTALFGGTATFGELLRTLGFANSPGVLYVLGFIPGLGMLIKLIVGLWVLVCGIVAIRQALDFSTGKDILTAIVGWLVMMIPLMLLGGAMAVLGGFGR